MSGCTLISGYILIGSLMGVDFFLQEENQLDYVKLEGGPAFHFVSVSVSFPSPHFCLCSLLSFHFPHPPSPELPATFSRTSSTWKGTGFRRGYDAISLPLFSVGLIFGLEIEFMYYSSDLSSITKLTQIL